MNKTRMKGQEMDVNKAGHVDPKPKKNKRGQQISPNIRTVWLNPFPSRAERRIKIRKRAGYTRTDARIKKAKSLFGRLKQRNGIMNKIFKLFTRRGVE